MRELDEALAVGVTAFEWGDSLANELVFNLILERVILDSDRDNPVPACVFVRGGKIVLHINPQRVLEIFEHVWKNKGDERRRKIALLRGFIKHELLHILFAHLVKDPQRPNRLLSNMVQDAIINSMIPEFEHLDIETITPEAFLEGQKPQTPALFIKDPQHDDITWEEYYDALRDRFGNRMCEFGEVFCGDVEYVAETEAPEEVLDTIQEIIETVKARGNAIGSYLEKVRVRRKKPTLSWRRLLRRKFIGYAQLVKTFTWKRFHKRFGTIPGVKMLPRSGKIRVFLDVSASISDEELEGFVAELKNAQKYGFAIEGYMYDVEIQRRFTEKDLQRKTIEVRGRGGTDINNALKNLELKPADITIIFTDGYDDIPNVERLRTKQLVFLLTKKHCFEYEREAKKIGQVVIVDA